MSKIIKSSDPPAFPEYFPGDPGADERPNPDYVWNEGDTCPRAGGGVYFPGGLATFAGLTPQQREIVRGAKTKLRRRSARPPADPVAAYTRDGRGRRHYVALFCPASCSGRVGVRVRRQGMAVVVIRRHDAGGGMVPVAGADRHALDHANGDDNADGHAHPDGNPNSHAHGDRDVHAQRHTHAHSHLDA